MLLLTFCRAIPVYCWVEFEFSLTVFVASVTTTFKMRSRYAVVVTFCMVIDPEDQVKVAAFWVSRVVVALPNSAINIFGLLTPVAFVVILSVPVAFAMAVAQ